VKQATWNSSQGEERVVPANAAAVSRRSATSTPSVVSIVKSAATLGEQARHSTRTIPAAIGWSLAWAAVIQIFFTWIVYSA
jgi:hypothetical protein